MSEIEQPTTVTQALRIHDYLEATSHAASRSRTAAIVVVVASVLVFAGLLNSLQNSWLLERIQKIRSISGAGYLASKIGPSPKYVDPPSAEYRQYEIRYREFYSALVRTYVDTSYVVRVPFFGITVDANDLGLLGGISFVIILVMLRFCISREVGNLKLSFEAAAKLGQLPEFYRLLAMRQVLTIPPNTQVTRSTLLAVVPKLFFIAPFLVHGSVVFHDFLTGDIGRGVSDPHTTIVLTGDVVLAIAILALTISVLTRLRRVDTLWSDTAKVIDLQLPSARTGSAA